MARVLSISSQVVYGHVGNSITTFVLQRFGHEVFAAPTVILSNRPGYDALAGMRIPAETLDAILEAGQTNGWLHDLDAVVTGYLPSVAHVNLCVRWITRLKQRQPKLFHLCDPILGDDPQGMYIDAEAAAALKGKLLQLADCVTPNRFELAWLSGRAVETAEAVVPAARSLRLPKVLTTSAPGASSDELRNVFLDETGVTATAVKRRTVHAHGTGDFFASFFLAQLLNGKPPAQALQAATVAMEAVLDASEGRSELALTASQHAWMPSRERD